MSHKTAKKVRKLLKVAMPTKGDEAREYVEDTQKRKKMSLATELGAPEQEYTVAAGQIKAKEGSRRAIYKVVKNAMRGQGLPKLKPAKAPPAESFMTVDEWKQQVKGDAS